MSKLWAIFYLLGFIRSILEEGRDADLDRLVEDDEEGDERQEEEGLHDSGVLTSPSLSLLCQPSGRRLLRGWRMEMKSQHSLEYDLSRVCVQEGEEEGRDQNDENFELSSSLNEEERPS